MHTFRQGRKVYLSFSKLGMEFDPLEDLFFSELPPESSSLQPFVEKHLCLWSRKSTAEFVFSGQALNKLYGSLQGRGGEGDGDGDGGGGRGDIGGKGGEGGEVTEVAVKVMVKTEDAVQLAMAEEIEVVKLTDAEVKT